MNKACESKPQSSTSSALLHLREVITEPLQNWRGLVESASMSVLHVKSVMSQQLTERLAGQLIAMHSMGKQGQQGSPRGKMEKEMGYIVIVTGVTDALT